MCSAKKFLNLLLISTASCHEAKGVIWRILLKTCKEICIKTENKLWRLFQRQHDAKVLHA